MQKKFGFLFCDIYLFKLSCMLYVENCSMSLPLLCTLDFDDVNIIIGIIILKEVAV